MKNPLQQTNETVDTELYDDLMSRYERVLVYAGQLQEKVKHQKLLSESTGNVEKENLRMIQLATLDKSYILLLERALEAMGVMRPGLVGRSQQIMSPEL